jgi:hypothetical protein
MVTVAISSPLLLYGTAVLRPSHTMFDGAPQRNAVSWHAGWGVGPMMGGVPPMRSLG